MATDVPLGRPVIVCPLEFERLGLARAGLGRDADLVCCGPGAEAIVRWAEHKGQSNDLVILAGLAGALRPGFAPGSAAMAATVIDSASGRSFPAPSLPRAETTDGHRFIRAAVASSPTMVTTPATKRALADRAGADLVDLESGAFALAATILGWRWAVVRGVSDGCDTKLPHDIDRWVNTAGVPRMERIAFSLITRPWMIPAIVRLQRHSDAALGAVALIVRAILAAHARTESHPLTNL